MQIKYGIDFQLPNILLLNEIQYSKNLLTIFYELLQDPTIVTQIIATGIVQEKSEEYKLLTHSKYVRTLIVDPMSFFDFLDYKQIHTTYLSLEKPSPVVFRELQ